MRPAARSNQPNYGRRQDMKASQFDAKLMKQVSQKQQQQQYSQQSLPQYQQYPPQQQGLPQQQSTKNASATKVPTEGGHVKLRVDQAITLITLRLGSVESKLIELEHNSHGMLGSGMLSGITTESGDSNQLAQVMSRIESLELRIGQQNNGPEINLLKQQNASLNQGILQLKNAITLVNKELASIKTNYNNLNDKVELFKSDFSGIQQQLATIEENIDSIMQQTPEESENLIYDTSFNPTNLNHSDFDNYGLMANNIPTSETSFPLSSEGMNINDAFDTYNTYNTNINDSLDINNNVNEEPNNLHPESMDHQNLTYDSNIIYDPTYIPEQSLNHTQFTTNIMPISENSTATIVETNIQEEQKPKKRGRKPNSSINL